jgi:glycosyltransferase involved in cell wall biosynthesis
MIERRILVISYHTPQPDRDSGSRRVFQFIGLLQEDGWDVTVLAADGVGSAHDVAILEQRSVAVYDGYRTTVDELLTMTAFDAVLIAYWPNAERYLGSIRFLSPQARIILDSVDLHFLRESRDVLRTASTRRPRGLDQGHGARFAAELNCYASADAVLTVSEKEANFVNDLVWEPNLAHAVHDLEEVPGRLQPFSRRRGIVCVGSFEHPPNVEAVEHLCRQIVPLIDPALLKDHPVRIVGNKLGDDVRKLGDTLSSVEMVGWVPSVRPYFTSSRISVVPLLHGAGTKRKLVQALAAGTPTVSTSIGVEGLDLEPGRHVLIADEPAAFAKAVERLLTDRRLWTVMARAGRKHVKATNGKAVARRQFRAALAAAFSRSPKHAPAIPVPVSGGRVTREEYEALVDRLDQKLPRLLPTARSVLVVSKGDDRLIQNNGRRAGHFPQDETGRWAGFHPRDSAAAIEHLERLRAQGADALVFPMTSFWWFEHYEGFTRYLEERYRLIHRDQDCEIFSLDGAETSGSINGGGGAEHSVIVKAEADERVSESSDDDAEGVRLIAFYLPQFHPIPENDAWWGKGFTEWRNVAQARPLFPGHYQPHMPADLGFYDLRLPETRKWQAELAKSAGIHGFCYYHYWFNGKRLLHRPLEEILASGEPDFPFALCWANDPWSRRWDGRDDDLLQAQEYSHEDDIAHIRWLMSALKDPRAITVDGKPMFLVYRALHLPDPARTCETWREEAGRAGLAGLHLVAVETAWDLERDATDLGFDAKVLFHPQFGWLMTHVANERGGRLVVDGKPDLQVYDYETVRQAINELSAVNYRRYESVFPGWDNTPRVADKGVVIYGATPTSYETWLRDAIARARAAPAPHRLIFVNAWNEWAEGCHLEPDLLNGRAYLQATRAAIYSATTAPLHVASPSPT